MLWLLDQFGGLAPRITDRLLPETWATEATDLDTLRPALFPRRDLTLIESAPAASKSVYWYNNAWLYSTNEQSFVRSFQPNDTDDKLYYSDYPNNPKIRSSGSTYNLGLPVPDAVTFGTITRGDTTTDPTLNETWIYTYTYVDSFGFEGAAAEPASAGTIGTGATSVVLNFPSLPTGSGINIDRIYVYRSLAGTDGSDFQFLVDLDAVTAAGSGYTDSIPSTELQEVLSAIDNLPPPYSTDADGALRTLVSLSGNILAGFTDRTVHLSKPNLPHAWPESNKYPVPESIVGIVDVQGGLLVLTREASYVLFGGSPDAMQLERLPTEQNCICKESIVRLYNRVYWASTDGLVEYNNGSIAIVTEDLLTREQWQTVYDPTTLHAFAYEGQYIAFGTQAFIYDARSGDRRLTHFTSALTLDHVFRREDQDETYLLLNDGAGSHTLQTWGTNGTATAYTWRSKLKQFPKTLCPSYLRIYTPDDATVNVRLIFDDEEFLNTALPSNELIRLPLTTKVRLAQIEVSGTTPIEIIALSDSLQEIP